jgi:hypothetical protein
MMGSGTVVAVARSKGHRAIGIDIDPLAVLLSKVWTTAGNADSVRQKATEVLRRAKQIFLNLAVRDAYPKGADKETREFIAYWFDPYARRQLTALSLAIGRVREEVVRDQLWCGFSRLIIAKQAGASLAMDLAHSRPHRRFDRAPIKPFRKFLSAVSIVADGCLGTATAHRGPVPTILCGDARDLPLKNSSVDLVLTSPPYLNAIDYMRCSKFSLVWMGHRINELRDIRARSIGTEVGKEVSEDDKVTREIIDNLKLRPKLPTRQEAILARYICDMRKSLSEVGRVLSPNGIVVYVVGENTVRGTYIRTSTIVSAVAAKAGLKRSNRQERDLPANRRYLPPPKGRRREQMDSRMRREVILTFEKSA